MSEQKKRRLIWGKTESLLVIVWFVVFLAFEMVFRGLGLLAALSQFLVPVNILLSVVVIFGILGLLSFVAGLRGK